MTNLSLNPCQKQTLLKSIDPRPKFAQINQLVEEFLHWNTLQEHLNDLPLQFETHKPRPWSAINWHGINPSQIVGVNPEVFLAVIRGSMQVEAPIRGYSKVSFQYLVKVHPQMAQLVGGKYDQNGSLLEPGLWEKEERQHTPALKKIYYQLTGEKIQIQVSGVKKYVSSGNPREDLYGHGCHRVVTEYGATSLYIWLLSHTTGELQKVMAEMVRDEINHTIKFWGFGLWLYPESGWTRLRLVISSHFQRHEESQMNLKPADEITQRNYLTAFVELMQTFWRVMKVMSWTVWSWKAQLELIFTFTRVFWQIRGWCRRQTREHLESLLGVPPTLPHENSVIL